MKKLFYLLLILPLFTNAQEGMHFEHGKNWKEIVEKASMQNKYIFVDAYTTWCGPCKYMSSKVFVQPGVGEFFNKNFINLKVQLDTTKTDSEDVKNWYAEGHRIMQDYKVNVFPTYLVFNPEGKIVHRFVGSMEATDFVNKGKQSLSPESQFYPLLAQYQKGENSIDFLRNFSLAGKDAYEEEIAFEAAAKYLRLQNSLATKDDVEFINNFTKSSADTGFAIMIANEKKINSLKPDGSISEKIVNILQQDFIFAPLYQPNAAQPDWSKISEKLSFKYPKYQKEVLAGGKVKYFLSKQDWINFPSAAISYMKEYGSKVNATDLNSYAWTIFENCKDAKVIKKALGWSKRSIELQNDPNFIDTYANLLYKDGQKSEAIAWEEKAMAMVDATEKESYLLNIAKMKKGDKTWKD